MFNHLTLYSMLRRLTHVVAVIPIAVSLALPVIPTSAQIADPCPAIDSPGCSFGLPAFQYQLRLTEMLAHPSPNVRPLQVDTKELNNFSFYKLINGPTPIYNAPGGALINTIAAGFNYVGVLATQGDYAEIDTNQWTLKKNLQATDASSYTGVLLDQPLSYPMGWVLEPIRASALPGSDPADGAPYIARYTRVNIFATKHVGSWDWYLIGPGQWLEQRKIARALSVKRPDGVKGRWVAVDLYEQVLVAYQDDQMVFTTLVASGLPHWDTNLGLFHIWLRAKETPMSGAMGRPDFYSLQSVPWAMFFDQDISLHGTYWHDGFGYRHSHGCVNMSITDAQWIFTWTDGFYANTAVDVWTSGQYNT